jgi:alpha-L-fucosidase
LYDPEKLALPANYQPVHPLDIGDMTCRDESLEAWPRTEDAIRRQIHDYYSLISGMDRDIGRLLDTLDQQSLASNTIVVFTSDQGIALGSHGLMGKQNLYEDTQRVPMLISGPGIPKGRSKALVYLHDLFPTLSELAGAEAPKDIDGRTLVPVLSGKSAKVRDSLMMSYTNTQRSIRDDRWKLIRFPQINRQLLFDLENDPHEMKNLAGDENYFGEIGRLSALLKAEQQRLGDKLPLVSKNPKPADFVAPMEKLPTPYPSGGLAPGVAPEPNRPKPAEVTGAAEMLNTKRGRYQIIHPSQPETAKRLEWFTDAKFGMFVHWGVYSTRGGIAPDGKPQQHGYTEWYQKANHMNHADYAKLANDFNPRHYAPEKWVLAAKQAGMRYITFTAKHHDGFAMFDTAHSGYDVVDATPYGRDVLKELRTACDKHGMKLCLYYSHCQDWEQWDAWQTNDWIYPEKKGQPVDHEKYLSGKVIPQLQELCQKFRPDGLWFDTPWFNEQKLDRDVSKRVSDTVRKFAPNALINSRIAHGSENNILHADLFDYLTLGDQEIPETKLPLYAESPDSITVSYGYDLRPGVKYRSASDLLRRMIRTVANGGNYLLNVGPSGDGEIPPQAIAELEKIGAWMKQNGAAIYGTASSPLGQRQPWGEATAKDGRIYLFPISHKGGAIEVAGLKQAPTTLKRLADSISIPFSATPAGIRFELPADNQNELPSVLVLEL